jgi:hypothetical protein
MKPLAGLLAAFLLLVTPVVVLSQSPIASQPAEGLSSGSYPMPGSHLLQRENEKVTAYVAQHPESVAPARLQKTSAWGFAVSTTHSWKAYDYDKQTYYDVASTCRAVGIHCYIFVQDSLWGTRVTQAAVDSVEHAFDVRTPANPAEGVYQMDVETFGAPPDIDGDSRIIILIMNIQDGFSGSGGFVAGYFWGGNEVLGYPNGNNAEIYYVDANPLDLTKAWGINGAMSTAAHEFQHMIHFAKDNSEVSFVNEGCSCYAESHCGYGIVDQSGYINETNHYLLDWRLVSDPNVLNDYSRAGRFFQYFGDQFGAGVFMPIVASKLHGIAGLDAGLTTYGADRRFAQIFPDWLVANILDDRAVNPYFGYLYTGLAKAVATKYTNPVVPFTSGTIASLGARYLTYSGGTDLHITFNTSSSSLVIKAVELGTPSRVLNVTPGVEFRESGFGTTYPTIHFVIINTSQSASADYSFQSNDGIQLDVPDPAAFLPTVARLEQNYPNPFNPKTGVRFQVSGVREAGAGGQGSGVSVKLVVYDLLGREVAVLVNERKSPGSYEVSFDGSGLPSGVYIYRLTAGLPDRQAGSFEQTKKMTLVK